MTCEAAEELLRVEEALALLREVWLLWVAAVLREALLPED